MRYNFCRVQCWFCGMGRRVVKIGERAHKGPEQGNEQGNVILSLMQLACGVLRSTQQMDLFLVCSCRIGVVLGAY